jgi:hypothetical protein
VRCRRRAWTVGTLAFLATVLIAFDHGGYYPTAWGWIALAASAWLCVSLLREQVSVGRHEAVVVGALVAFGALVALSSVWETPARGLLEAERAAMYALALAAVIAGVRRGAVEAVLAGTFAGCAVAAGYGLLTRLLPERLGVFDPVARIRLSEPLGYWNALGAFCAIGLLLGFGLASRASRTAMRVAAAFGVPVLASTLYFTYSRGAWIVLVLGACTWIAVDARRLQALATVLPLAAVAGAGVLLAARSPALNRVGAPLPEAVSDGQRLEVRLLIACVAAGLLAWAAVSVERRWTPTVRTRRTFGVTLATTGVALFAALFIGAGAPHTLVARAYHGFAKPPPAVGADMSERLFSWSGTGRVPQWRVALRDFERSPIIGNGAGSYELAWNELRPYPAKIRDAHSLYLETLSELGLVGLAVLLVALGTPLVAGLRTRHEPLTPAVLGAYVAFLVHAGVDWDWEMPSVTLMGLVCGGVLLVTARRAPLVAITGKPRTVVLASAVALTAFSVVGLVGNRALANADAALRDGDVTRAAERASDGLRWAPWSAAGRRIEAETLLANGDLRGARRSFRRAVAADPRNWELWFALAQVTSGGESSVALERAEELNPRSPDIRAYRQAAESS